MKNSSIKNTATAFSFSLLALPLQSQATGNEVWNENNRFKNNTTYQAAPAPFDADDAEYGRASAGYKSKEKKRADAATYQWSFGDGQSADKRSLMQTIQNNVSTYYDGNDMVFNISVLYNAAANSHVAIFHINQAGKKVQELDSLMQKRINKFITSAQTLGLKKEDFHLDMIALVPIFEKEKKTFSKTYMQVPKGFEMQKNLHVKFKNPAHLDALFTFAAQNEIYDLIKVEYQVDSTEMALQSMRQRALKVLNTRLNNAKQMGISLDTCFRTYNEKNYEFYPIDQYMPYKPLAISSIDESETAPASGAITAPVQRNTMFYNQLPSKGFDAVINPSPLQPTIQFAYTLQVRYRLKDTVVIQTKTEVKKQTDLLIITPQGTIKEITK